MIKANLLRTRVTKATQQSSEENFDIPESSDVALSSSSDALKAIISFLIIIIFPIALVVYERFNLKVLRDQSKSIQRELQTITSQISQKQLESKRVQEVQSKVTELEQKTKELVDLTQGRLVKIKGLDFLQNIIPERVWLTSIEAKEKKIIMSGFAVNDDDLSEFLKKLDSANYFQAVVLQKSQEAKTKDGLVKFFEILAQEGAEQ